MNDNLTLCKKFLRQIGKPVLLGAALLCAAPAFAADTSDAPKKGHYPAYPKIDYSKVAEPKLVKKGEYLAKAGDCIACHTAENSNKALAGGLDFASPLGHLYSPNITFDKKQGIGKWTEKQFAKALREGVSPTGSFYYPAFPYRNFNSLSDADVHALYAYFKAVPTYSVKNKKNGLIFPLNWRFLQLGWRMLFFYPHKDGPYKADSKRSKSWNRGKYLVEGPGHCDMCHTKSYYLLSPKFTLAAPIRKYNLAGANIIGGYRAPDITSNLMKDVPLSEITQVFLEDKLIGGGKVAQPPMLEVNHNSLSHLKIEDLEAIGTYLKTVKSKTPPISSSGDNPGEAIYTTYCAACHTTGAGGAPKLGNKTAWDPLIKLGMDTLYSNVASGIAGMPRKGNCNSCTDAQLHEAVDYIVAKAQSPNAVAGPVVKPLHRLSLADGKHVYTTYCAACHNPGTSYLNAPTIGKQSAWDPILKQGMDQVILHTLRGYGAMAPKGACVHCTDEQVIVAVKYMANQSKRKGNYQLW
jgi:cytochrome c5